MIKILECYLGGLSGPLQGGGVEGVSLGPVTFRGGARWGPALARVTCPALSAHDGDLWSL